MMGLYLSHLRNQKADPVRARVPDQNFAREVMQLFSIGLTEINLDGTPKLVNGQPVETYTNADITGLARVFTGWSWAAQDTSNASFNGGGTAYADRVVRPMQPYPQFHETGEKTFLNVTIPASTSAQESLKIALDTLFNHPNVPVHRPAADSAAGDQQSVPGLRRARRGRVREQRHRGARRHEGRSCARSCWINEARSGNALSQPQFGKLREPVLRLSQWADCFGATSASGNWLIRNLDERRDLLAQQTAACAVSLQLLPAGYVPANTAIASAGLVAPEFQITGETSVAGYTNFMQAVIADGVGVDREVRASYTTELAEADNADCADQRRQLVADGRHEIYAAAKPEILDAVNAISAGGPNGPSIASTPPCC